MRDIADVVRGWFMRPVFAQARGSARDASPGSFYASTAYSAMNARLGQDLDKLENSIYDIGYDGINTTNVMQNTCQVVFLRCGATMQLQVPSSVEAHITP